MDSKEAIEKLLDITLRNELEKEKQSQLVDQQFGSNRDFDHPLVHEDHELKHIHHAPHELQPR